MYRAGVLWVALWFAIAIAYFALHGRKRLILSPEEDFALRQGGRTAPFPPDSRIPEQAAL